MLSEVAAVVAAGVVLAICVPADALERELRYEEVHYSGAMSADGLVLDATPHHRDGVVLTGGGGDLVSRTDRGGDRYLRFPSGSCVAAPCPQAIVQPIDFGTLVPGDAGTGRFVFGADIRLTEPPSQAAGMNVFQFGAAGPGLRQWKLQADYGRPSCRWSDGTTVVLLFAPDPEFRLPRDVWVRVRCARLSPVLFAMLLTDRATGEMLAPPTVQVAHVGAILPTGVVVIGGKRIDPRQSDVDTDQFHGDLDEIFFRRE